MRSGSIHGRCRWSLWKISDSSSEVSQVEGVQMKNGAELDGNDDRNGGSTLSSGARLLQVAQELMWDQDLTPAEIIGVVEKFYGREKARCSSFSILRNGFHCSFQSEIPFVTASIYFRNMRTIYPLFEIELCTTAARMFKNMVMERGSTGVVIRSEPEFCAVQREYFDAFRVSPPKRVNVFAALIQDRSCIRKILVNPEYFKRIVDIFSFVEPCGVTTLRARILAEYQQELERLTETGASESDGPGITDRLDSLRHRMSVIRETKVLSTQVASRDPTVDIPQQHYQGWPYPPSPSPEK